MKLILKWLLIIGGVFTVLIVVAVVIIPHVINVQQYKPLIERKVAEVTGRSFTLGDKMDISIFPWVGVKLTDLHLGNPAGHKGKEMAFVKNFEVRLRLMPLLSKQIEIKTFVLDSPKIYLEKLKSGAANWQGIGRKQEEKVITEREEKPAYSQGLPVEALKVDNFSITNGQLVYVDQATSLKKEITDLNLNLVNLSLENPVRVSFRARIDGKLISLNGTVGPIGKEPGKGRVALDIVLKVLGELEVKLNGSIVDPMVSRIMDIEVKVASFSPRKFFTALNQNFPFQTKDPNALNTVSLKTRLKGDPESMSMSEGEFQLDDSKLTFSSSIKEFSKPDLKFDFQLDRIDLDRYLPVSPAGGSGPVTAELEKKKINYDPLRDLVLDGKIKIGKLTAHGAKVENFDVHILARNGIITMNPIGLNFYQGTVASTVELNIQKNDPRTKVTIDANGIQVGPLIKDTMKEEFIVGTLKAAMGLAITGETPAMIKQTLAGQGELSLTDGAIIGVDLARMVRNVGAGLGLGEQSTEKPRTDFTEVKIPFSANNGIVNTSGTSLRSPLIRALVTGDANFVKELLHFRVAPKFVATLIGQGDTQQRSGLMVPILITGDFSSPEFRPDIEGMLSEGGILDTEELKQALGTKEDQRQKNESVEENVKRLIRGFFPGLKN